MGPVVLTITENIQSGRPLSTYTAGNSDLSRFRILFIVGIVEIIMQRLADIHMLFDHCLPAWERIFFPLTAGHHFDVTGIVNEADNGLMFNRISDRRASKRSPGAYQVFQGLYGRR
jgi:hypothetical protein